MYYITFLRALVNFWRQYF